MSSSGVSDEADQGIAAFAVLALAPTTLAQRHY
eukprot:COSAG02_NODE_54815_length_294_cov_0.630769_1_plen_32_part_10